MRLFSAEHLEEAIKRSTLSAWSATSNQLGLGSSSRDNITIYELSLLYYGCFYSLPWEVHYIFLGMPIFPSSLIPYFVDKEPFREHATTYIIFNNLTALQFPTSLL